MARISPALQKVIAQQVVGITNDTESVAGQLEKLPRRQVLNWRLKVKPTGENLWDIILIRASIERMNYRAGLGLPLDGSKPTKKKDKAKTGTVAPKVAEFKTANPKESAAKKAQPKAKTKRDAGTAQVVPKTSQPKASSKASPKVVTPTVMEPVHLILVLDISTSMRSCLVEAGNQLRTILKTAQVSFGNDTTVTVFTFGNNVQIVTNGVRIAEARAKHTTYPYLMGSTPLNDAICQSVATVLLQPEQKTLVYLITDGEENNSRSSLDQAKTSIQSLLASPKATFVAIGPDKTVKYFKALGIATGNVKSWGGGTEELKQVTTAVVAGIQKTEAAFKAGKKKVDDFFLLDIDGGSIDVVAKMCVDVTSTMERRTVQQGGIGVEEYINKHCKSYTYVPGAFFYKLVTKEKLKSDRRIVIAHRDDARLFSGPQARTMLGLPSDRDVVIEPGSLGKWAIFVQSAAPNRKTVKDCEFLWDKTATGNVKPTWT